MESYIHSKEFQRKVAKVGKGSAFSYRSIFDPVPSSAVKKSWLDNKQKE